MSVMRHIRRVVFGVTQAEFSKIAGVGQAAVSRWENEACEPARDAMERIRAEALKRKIEWKDEWFFGCAPTPPAPAKPKRKAA